VKRWMSAHRVVVGIAAIVVLVLVGGGYVAWTVARQPAPTENAAPPAAGDLVFVDLTGDRNLVTTVKRAQPDGPRTVTDLRCQRYYRAVATSVCLRIAGPGPSYEAAVWTGATLVKTIPLPGIPSRAQVSADGDVVSWTSFVTGDSYTVPGGFSTRSGVYNVKTGDVMDSIEHFKATIGGHVSTAADINYWGITVGADDNTFYATLATSGRTYLMRGDLATRTLQEVRQTAECPSISPDGKRVAYKKRPTPTQPWELVVLDLAGKRELVLPGTAGIDDQAVWLDDSTLAYGAAVANQRSAVFFVAADGSAPARRVIPDAASPVPVR
jgi:hypothetical protein